MTIKVGYASLKKEATALLLLGFALFCGIGLSGEISGYVKAGFDLAIGTVIPTSLPFMVISDLYVCYGHPENITALKKVFTRIFGFSEYSLAPFICGNVGGFPIGAKMSADCYAAGLITRKETERLIALSNNPSCAFIIGGIGLGIYGDIKIGFMLLASVYTATLICAALTRCNTSDNHITGIIPEQNYAFVKSVKDAGTSLISIISFISIFSALNGIVKKRIKHAPVLYVFSVFSEVTNAIQILSVGEFQGSLLPLMLSAFALGFGGLCVGLQSAVFTSAVGLKMKKYYLIKLLEGTLSASVFSILFTLIK